MIELYEENIQDWYMNHSDSISIQKFLCHNLILKNEDKKCLYEIEESNKKQEL